MKSICMILQQEFRVEFSACIPVTHLFNIIITVVYFYFCNLLHLRSWYSDSPRGFESRWRREFSVPVHTGPGAHPASPTQWVLGLSPGGRAAETWHSPPNPLQRRGWVWAELYLNLPLWLLGMLRDSLCLLTDLDLSTDYVHDTVVEYNSKDSQRRRF